MEKFHTDQLQLEPHDNQRLANLCGLYDENLHLIENRMHVKIRNRGHAFEIIGKPHQVSQTQYLLDHLYQETANAKTLTPESVQLFLQSHKAQTHKSMKEPNVSREKEKHLHTHTERHHPLLPQRESGIITTKHHIVKAHGEHQTHYVDNIRSHPINFAIGPSGTGKTYLAVACAVSALERHEVNRIVLVRPAVEAGEKLGFLPGDMQQKVDPYLRPLYDGLFDLLGIEHAAKLVERNVIEVAPLAYMRGRTLNDAFIILDEAQNTTPVQMKMFLTRLGFGSTIVATGDTTQTDLRGHKLSGLEHALKVLPHVSNVSITKFDADDVVRHPLVQAVVEAYDNFEGKSNTNE